MTIEKPEEKFRNFLYRYSLIAIFMWSVVIGVSLAWNISNEKKQSVALALNSARENFNKDKAFRLWGTKHGGVYVPPTEKTPPNPYLAHLKERDVVTTDGKKLTLMNPAYMIKQVMDDYTELFGITGRIVGQVALNPDNLADEFESKAIDAFIAGTKDEVIDQTIYKGKPHLRLVRPFVMEKGCVQCHGHLGFKVGDVRGAIGVSIPLETYTKIGEEGIRGMIFSHTLIYILGLIGIAFIAYRSYLNLKERQRVSDELRELNQSLEERIKAEVEKNQKQDKQLFEQSRLAQMGEMISMIAHQWRQPLAAISATAIGLKFKMDLEAFDLDTKEGQDEQGLLFRESLTKIESYTQNLSTTIDDFRNFYKPNKKTVITNFESIVTKSLSIIQDSFISDEIELAFSYNSSEEMELHDNEMMQVVLNILKNAQDNFKEKQTKNPKITISTDTKSLSVWDNGGGISENVLKQIFDPYFSTKDEKNGTGLGLYMSKIIIEEHHKGTLKAYNKNDGVCFEIQLKNANV